MTDRNFLQEIPKYLMGIIFQCLPDLAGISYTSGLLCFEDNPNYTICYLSQQIINFLGFTKKEEIESNSSFLDLIYPDDRTQFIEALKKIDTDTVPYTLEVRLLKKDNTFLLLQCNGKSQLKNGKRFYVNFCFNISEILSLHKESSSLFPMAKGYTNNLPCGICKFLANENFTILNANSLFYEIYGYTKEQAIKDGFSNMKFIMYHPDFEISQKIIAQALNNNKKEFELEYRSLHCTGKIIWTLARCTITPSSELISITCVLLDITERKTMEEQLRISEEENRIAFRNTNKIMNTFDIATRTLIQPQKIADIFGLPIVVENVPYSVTENGMVAQNSIQNYIQFYESMIQGIPQGECVVQLKHKDGTFHWYTAKYSLILNKDGTPKKGILFYDDITQQREKELAYQKWSQYFSLQKENSIGYYEYNLTKDLFEGHEEELSKNLPKTIRTFTGAIRYIANHFVYEEDLKLYLDIFTRESLLLKFYSNQRTITLEYRRKRYDESIFWVQVTIQLIPDPYTEDIKAFILVNDIDKQKQEFLKLQERLEKDALTGIFNRASIIEKVNAILSENRKHQTHALIMLDIDYFKHLNDSFGHQFGDCVLKDVSTIMQQVLLPNEFCGRLAGDEFIMLFLNIRSIAIMEKRLKRLCHSLKISYKNGARVSISIGASIFPYHGKTFEELYHYSDVALYEAKGRGRNQYVIYQEKLSSLHTKNFAAETEQRKTLNEKSNNLSSKIEKV